MPESRNLCDSERRQLQNAVASEGRKFSGGNWREASRDFSISENALPKRVAFLIDASGSMSDRYAAALQLAQAFLPYVGHQTRFAVYLFSDKLYTLLGYEERPELLFQKQLPPDFQYAQGHTALFDSVATVVGELDNPDAGDVVIVFTDAGDNHSKLTGNKLRALIVEDRVRVYVIFTPTYLGRTPEELAWTEELLHDVVARSGGQWLVLSSAKKEPDFLREQSRTIMGQLEIPYRLEIKLPERLAKDSEWKLRLEGINPKLAKKFHLIYPRDLARCGGFTLK